MLSFEKEDFEELDVVCKIFDDSADDVLKVDVAVCGEEKFVLEDEGKSV